MPDEPGGVVRFARVGDVDVAGPDLLSAPERDRLARLRRPQDRAAYRAAHVLVRQCAAALLGAAPGDLVLRQECPGCGRTGHGRPGLVGHPGVGLALSHSGAHVGAAAVHGVCGVDVEDLAPAGAAGTGVAGERVPDRALSPAERAWVARRGPDAALRLWVRKESLVKAGVADLDRAAALDVVDAEGRLRGHAHGFALGEWRGAGAVGAWAAPTGTRISLAGPAPVPTSP